MIAYEVEGPKDGPVLVLCNSLGATTAMWAEQRQALRDEVRVVSIETRGHGRSPVLPGPYAVADLGGDVLEVLDELGVASASVAGVSLGGAVAQWLAFEAPDRIDSLTLICTSARFGDPQPWHERAATVRAQGTGAVADAVVARWVTEGWGRLHPERVASMRAMIASTPREGYAACCEAIAAWDAGEDLAAINAPTLVVAAEQDPATPPEHAHRLASGVSGARLEIVDPGAHLVNVERPDLIGDLLREQVRGHSTAGRGARR